MKVLAGGGTADGEWVEVSDGVREFRRLKPQTFNWRTDEKVDTEIEYEIYRVWDINLLGFGMKVASLSGLPDEGRAVLKALVRRDVFAHLTNPRRTRGT